jgi:hypothetical protein
MRFMMMIKHSKEMSGPPPKELMDELHKMGEHATKSGAMVASGGLAPVEASTTVRISRGQLSTKSSTDGPFTEAKEIVGGFAIFDLKSHEEAIASALEFMEMHRKHWPGWEGATEIRQIFGPEDISKGC